MWERNLGFLGLFTFLLPLQVFGAGVVINEVLFNPIGNDPGQEWIEVFNASDSVQNLNGWQLYPDGIGYFSFQGICGLVSLAINHAGSSWNYRP